MRTNLAIPVILLPSATAFSSRIHLQTHLQPLPIRLATQLQAIEFAEPTIPILAAAALGVWWLSGSEDRAKKDQYTKWEAQEKEYRAERERLAYVEPKDLWTVDELKQYNGEDEDGPILLAVKGDVFNVWKGKNFYGKDGEYHIMAGRDATRFLAKNRLEEENEDELKVALNVAERANLEVSVWKCK